MKKAEIVYREMLYQAMEKKSRRLTQASLASELKVSLSTVNSALKPLARMNAVSIGRMGLNVIDARKILFYWAGIRNLEKDIIYRTRVEKPVMKIEAEMPPDAVFCGYSAFRLKFNEVPADYSEVYAYGGGSIMGRFPESGKAPNLFVLKMDDAMAKYGSTGTLAQVFVDLWNLREWYAKDFLNVMEAKLNGILE